MKPLPGWLALAFLGLLGSGFAAPSPVIWTLQDAKQVGGFAPTVWGAPQVMGDGSMHFDGKRDGLLLLVNPIAGWGKFTVATLIRPESDAPEAQRFFCIDDDHGERLTLETRVVAGQGWYVDSLLQGGTPPPAGGRCVLIDPKKMHPLDQWAWVELTYDGRTMATWVDGVHELAGELAFAPMSAGKTSVGVRINQVFWYKGQIKEVRYYPAALSSADLPRVP